MTEAVDIAVIGGGPAGLAAATRLRDLDAGKVVVFERESSCGGATRHCGHPTFGWREMRRLVGGPRYAERLEATARAAGVDIRTGHTVRAIEGEIELDVLTPNGRRRVAARRVLLATGARESSRSARLVSGERPLGILTTGALQSHVYLEKLRPFRRPVIVGTELVALSSLLTCRTHGIAPAAVIEPGPRPVARWPLSLFPKLLGIPCHVGAEIVDIQGSPRVEQVVVRLADGRSLTIACDGVLFTGQFVPETTLAKALGLEVHPTSGVLAIDQFGRTSRPRIFAAGNGIRPVETAGWCWSEGRAVADALVADLKGLLPAAGTGVEIRVGAGIRFATPSRIWGGAHDVGLGEIQLRLQDRLSGRITIRSKGREIWSHRLRSGAERRILLPLRDVVLPSDTTSLMVTLEAGRERGSPVPLPSAPAAASGRAGEPGEKRFR